MFKVLVTSLFISLSALFPAFAQFDGGSGTARDPYQITNIRQLQSIRDYPDKHYIITKNIEAKAADSLNKDAGFEPIGTEQNPFTGSLDGQYFTIYNLSIVRPDNENTGLFGFINGGTVNRVKLKNTAIQGGNITGGIAGKVADGAVQNSTVTGRISGHTYIGGIVGFNRGNIKQCETDVSVEGFSYVGGAAGINRGRVLRTRSMVKVTGTGHNAGGLIGSNYDGLVIESQAHGTVLADKVTSVGGLAGSNGGTIARSFSSTDVTGKTNVGGFVGNNYTGRIKWSYSTGDVSGLHFVGGFAGVNLKNSEIHQAYSTGAVSGTEDAGGFIGLNELPVHAGYWNQDASPGLASVHSGIDDGIQALPYPQFIGAAGLKAMNGFSFDTRWGYVSDGPPELLWTIPYFTITDLQTMPTIVSGDAAHFTLTLKNVGEIIDMQPVIVTDQNNEVILKSERKRLKGGDSTTLNLVWQTNTDTKGTFDLTFSTRQNRTNTHIEVRRLPSSVELKLPYDLEDNVSVSPTFEWEEAFLANTYELQLSENDRFDPVKYRITDIDTTFYKLDKKLEHQQYYHWRVRGINDDEKGPWSEQLEFITIVDRPEKVVLKYPENELNEAPIRPTFSWSETSRAEKYRLQVAQDDEFESVMIDTTVIAIDSSLVYNENLPSKKKLYWRMQAQNIGGKSAWSETRSFIPVLPPEDKKKKKRLDFALQQNYPNPFNPITYIRYSIPEPSQVKLEVLNMLGQTVATLEDDYKSSGWHTVTFDASKLSSGFYIYRIKAGDYTAAKKLSVVK